MLVEPGWIFNLQVASEDLLSQGQIAVCEGPETESGVYNHFFNSVLYFLHPHGSSFP